MGENLLVHSPLDSVQYVLTWLLLGIIVEMETVLVIIGPLLTDILGKDFLKCLLEKVGGRVVLPDKVTFLPVDFFPEAVAGLDGSVKDLDMKKMLAMVCNPDGSHLGFAILIGNPSGIGNLSAAKGVERSLCKTDIPFVIEGIDFLSADEYTGHLALHILPFLVGEFARSDKAKPVLRLQSEGFTVSPALPG